MRQVRRRLVMGVVLTVVMLAGGDILGEALAGEAIGHPPGVQSLWVELGPAGVTIARAVTTRADCPVVDLGARSQPMYTRAPPDSAGFPVRVCETIIAPGVSSATVEG